MTHDRLCVFPVNTDNGCLMCNAIAKARADEREQAAQRVSDPVLHEAWCYLARPYPGDPAGSCDCYHAACIAAARGEEQ